MVTGMKTVFSPLSMASMHRLATNSRFKPCLFESLSFAFKGPASTADARKSPSTVDGMQTVKAILGCSIERAW